MTARISDTAVRAAAVSVFGSAAVLALKAIAWFLTGSVALYSDALESVVNVVAAAVVLVTLRYAARAPDHNHPYGHTKAEYLSAVLEGALIALAAVAIVREAAPRLAAPAAADLPAEGIAASLAASAMNGALALYLIRSGRRHRSPALVTDGWHVLADVVTSCGVLVGLAVAWLTGAWILDPVLAILVALYVLWTGWRLVRKSVGGLMDEGLPEPELAELERSLESAMAGAIEIHDLKTRSAGPRTFVEFHLVVPGGMGVEEAHAICDRLEEAVRARLPGAHVAIHVEPHGEAGRGRVVVGPHGKVEE